MFRKLRQKGLRWLGLALQTLHSMSSKCTSMKHSFHNTSLGEYYKLIKKIIANTLTYPIRVNLHINCCFGTVYTDYILQLFLLYYYSIFVFNIHEAYYLEIAFNISKYGQFTTYYSQIFLSWQLGAERQTCHVTLIVAYVMN